MINVTKPFLPPKEEYIKYVDGIWNRNWLTNHGPLVNELEQRLKEYLNVPYLFYVTNGTIAIQIAIKALEKTGEIITTPFSYVATTSSIVWEGCTPIFVDIDPQTLTIDPKKIEDAINEKTIAILATHVYGNVCHIDQIEKIASKHNLKVIYDGAHAFGTKYQNISNFNFGDISTISFHSTKLFHTTEGGAIITKDPELAHKISYLRNFGHNGPEAFFGLGVNGKNSEFHAAMGLCNLNYIGDILATRKALTERYNQKLKKVTYLKRPALTAECDYNYAYYPVLFDTEERLLKAIQHLNKFYIFPRRYFYPSLHTLSYVEQSSQDVSLDASKRALCLPLFHTLSFEEVDMISGYLAQL